MDRYRIKVFEIADRRVAKESKMRLELIIGKNPVLHRVQLGLLFLLFA